MAASPLPPQETLLQLFSYDPDNGSLRHRERPYSMFEGVSRQPAEACARTWNKKNAGKKIALNPEGYARVSIFKKSYLGHRIIFKMMTGRDPLWIDHINGNRGDNRWVNLREVSRVINNQNMRIRDGSVSQCHGVTKNKRERRWRVRITVDKTVIKLGSFLLLEDAIKARKAAETKYGFHHNHGRLGV